MLYYNFLYQQFSYYLALGISVAYLLFLIIVIFLVSQFFFVFLAKLCSKNSILYKILSALKTPFIIFATAFSMFSCIEAAYMNSTTLLFEIKNFNYYVFFKFATYISILWFINNFIKLTEKELIRYQSKFSSFIGAQFITTASLAARVIVFFIFGMNFLSMMGVELKTLLTFGGLSGFLISFAAKDFISSALVMVTVNLDRVFNVGDVIGIPSISLEGVVERISWRVTVVRQFNKIPVYLPNSIFSNAIVQNMSRRSHRFFNEVISVNYPDIESLNASINALTNHLTEHSEIDSINEGIIVRLTDIDGNFANLNIRCYIMRTAWDEYCKIATQIFGEIRDLLYKEYKIEIFKKDTIYQINVEGGNLIKDNIDK